MKNCGFVPSIIKIFFRNNDKFKIDCIVYRIFIVSGSIYLNLTTIHLNYNLDNRFLVATQYKTYLNQIIKIIVMLIHQ